MARGGMYININLTERRLRLYQGDKLYGSYLVAIGKPSTPSPLGKWTIVNKTILPPGQVYGTRWMGLSKPRYGIHGNNNPNSIGKAVSNGCIRMYNPDVEHIFPLIPIGTVVEIVQNDKGGGYPPPSYNPGSGPVNNPTTPQGGRTHLVKKGETLWSISRSYNVPLQDLYRLNPEIQGDLIYPGQVIKLP